MSDDDFLGVLILIMQNWSSWRSKKSFFRSLEEKNDYLDIECVFLTFYQHTTTRIREQKRKLNPTQKKTSCYKETKDTQVEQLFSSD